MYGFITKLLVSGKLKFEEGKIIFAEDPMTFFPLKTMKEMTIDAMGKGKKAVQELYYYGWHFGYTFTRDYMKTLKLRPFEETYKLIMEVAALIGYGDYKTLSFEQKKYSKFKNIDNPFGKLFYPSKEKVCHFARGMNAGGGTALHGVLMNGIELECTANNGKYCLFMNVANSILKEKYSKISKKQLDFKWLKPKQLAVIEESGEDPNKFLE